MKVLSFFIVLLLVGACRKNVAKENIKYVGTWSQRKDVQHAPPCEPYVLEITPAGNGSHYTRSTQSECFQSERYSGKAKKRKQWLWIGTIHKLKIDQEPTEIDSILVETGAGHFYSTMQLKLNGRTYYKKPSY